MRLFDLHCDTITECFNKEEELYKNDLHISLSKAEYLNKWCQFFAVWMPDEYRGKDACDYFENVYKYYKEQMKRYSDIIMECQSVEDLKESQRAGKYSSILSIEGGSAIAADLKRIGYLRTLGVRMLTLTWNGANEISDGCLTENAQGLTEFGKKAVNEMENQGIIIDVSHLSRKGFWDVASLTQKPFVASHSDCDGVFSHPRNLTNEQICLIIEREGLIGVNLYRNFIGSDSFDDVYAHISHILDIGGQDVISLGCDFDGCELCEEMAGIDKLKSLYNFLLSKGINQKTIDACFYDNAYNFFINNL